MNTFTSPDMTSSLEEKRALVADVLGRPVGALEEIHGGRNSRVFRFESDRPLIAKFYHGSAADDRDRLGVEFTALRFLWKHGVGNVPEPLVSCRTENFAVYGFLEGSKISGAEATTGDLEQAADFAGRLRELMSAEGALALAPASEARFSVPAVIENLQSRLARLEKAGADSPALSKFVSGELGPACARLCARAAKLGPAGELPRNGRTLSHSDFGFHNALRDRDGRLAFVDFEYFGWDDPAKMISDFMLQPVMGLDSTKRQFFFAAVLRRFDGRPELAARVSCVYPLFALKWATILLNEFVPGARERRNFSGRAGSPDEQIAKARSMVERALSEEDFPYHG